MNKKIISIMWSCTFLAACEPQVLTAGAGSTDTIDASKLCTDTTINGVTGTRDCSGGGGGETPTTLDVSAVFASGTYNAVSNKPATSSYLPSVTLFGDAGTMTLGSNVSGTNGSLSSTIPQGYYDGTKTCSASDTSLLSSNIKSGATIFGVAGLSSVVDTASGDAAATDILSGKKAFVNGSLVTGSMATRTLSAASTTVNAGYYAATTLTAVDADLVSSNIKSGATIFGVAGLSSVVDTASGDAAATDILSGKKAYVNGSLVTGSVTTSSPTQSAVDAGSENDDAVTSVNVTPTAGSLFSGFTVSLGAQFQRANICAGKTIFGRVGTAACIILFGDVTASGAHHDIGSQITLSSEVNNGFCSGGGPTTRATCEANGGDWIPWPWDIFTGPGYRGRPLVNKDHDGFSPNGGGNDPDGNPNPQNLITKADTSAITSCGTTQTTIKGRIEDCNYSWDGAVQGNSGEGKWSLVTKVDTSGNGSGPFYEVWRDERTQLLWSDTMGTINWCQAAGNIENSGDTNDGWQMDCTPGAGSGLQPATPVSMCTEQGGFDSSGYNDQKGGMRLVKTSTSPSVAWRLPTRSDYLQAYVNGMGYVLPNIFAGMGGPYFWTASVTSYNRFYAWIFTAYYYGHMSLNNVGRDGSYSVRCVGR